MIYRLMLLTIIGMTLSCSDNKEEYSKKAVPAECDSTTIITGHSYNVNGDDVPLRVGHGLKYEKLINKKATEVLKTVQYASISSETKVFEECIVDNWSWVRVIDPEWLKSSHKGWVETKYLDKNGSIKNMISPNALLPYKKSEFPKLFKKYGSRISDIEQFRKRAAEMAISSEKCDYVIMSELSDKSTISMLQFWVDCRNNQRVRISEKEIRDNAKVLTEEEKSWDERSARKACMQGIKDRALIPNTLNIHDIIGTSYYKAPVTQNAVLKMDFDVINAFGVKLQYVATCNFEPGKVGNIEINQK